MTDKSSVTPAATPTPMPRPQKDALDPSILMNMTDEEMAELEYPVLVVSTSCFLFSLREDRDR
jgi:hypothetical protein